MHPVFKGLALFGGGFLVGRFLRPHEETREGLAQVGTELLPDFPEPETFDELLEMETEDGYKVAWHKPGEREPQIIGKVWRREATADSQWFADLWEWPRGPVQKQQLPGKFKTAEIAARNLRMALP